MSSSSETSSIATISRAGALLRRSSIEVKIHRHYRSKVYTTGSTISGEAVITPQRDTPFDQIHIVFVGTTRTRLEALQVPQRSSHTFLRLSMPIPESAYPLPRVFEAGQTYSIPFHFVVPSYLTISACNHPAQSEYIHDYHMRMPPTVGFWEKDDLAPETATVEYSIKARVLRHPSQVTEQRPLKLFEAHQLINVLPASLEDPPLSITSNDRNYTLTKTKSIRKKLLGAKLGHFTATADQPAPVRLSSDGHSAHGTAANLYLTFQPSSSDIAPPKVTSVSAKLSAVTYYSASPMTRLPNLGGRNELSTAPRLAYSTSVPLFNTEVDKVTWKHHNGSQIRRDSGYSSDHREDDASGRRGSAKKTCPVHHTAALHIPFKLPVARKFFLPTFHACLVSRVYVLNLTLSVGSTSVSLALPLQVTVESDNTQLNQGLPSFDSVLAEQEAYDADEHLRPRLLQLPPSDLQQEGVLPGYDDGGLYRPVVRAGVAY